MKMPMASTVFIAAIIAGAAARRRVLEDIVPVVGVRPTGAVSSTDVASGTTAESTTAAEEETLIKALEFDDNVTVISPIEVGELLCDTLRDAEDSPSLSFTLLDNEKITAEKTSYYVTNGSAFTDGIGRQVWTGTVTDPIQDEDEAVPRTVSMVWGDVCHIESFLLKVTKLSTDETTSIVKTVPCYGSTTHTCLVEVEVEFGNPGKGVTAPYEAHVDSATRADVSDEGSPNDYSSTPGDSRSSDRRLQSGANTVIDVMVLYTPDSLTALGGVTPAQMETKIIESIARTNQAFDNSEVALVFNAVHVGPLPYLQTATEAGYLVNEITYEPAVWVLRDEHGADLVQVVGSFDGEDCGEAWTYSGLGSSLFSTSVVSATCLDNYAVARQFGHNLGCYPNRDDARINAGYPFGFRYCDGTVRFRTIMSERCESGNSPYANYFSNPDVNYLGKPTGTATDNCAQTIRDNMVDVSNFRDSVTNPSTGYTLLGCYRDTLANRVLTGAFKANDRTMTTEACSAFCEGSPYFGTEYGKECFCGVNGDNPTEAGSASCTYSCAGDASQTCGGFNAITVYQTTQPLYRGCWTDPTSDRIMDVVWRENAMTNDRCAEICGSYPFYGTQYGRECWCGNATTDYTSHGVSTRCTFGCAGDSSQKCGGFNAMSVYEKDAVASPTEYLGCWRDFVGGRILDVVTKENSMTNDLCKGICSAYAFYGTQYGKECWCGDASSDYTANGGSTSCNMNCAGDSGSKCGGFNAMSVWKYT